MSYNAKQVVQDNTKALQIALENKTGRYTNAEIEALRKYKRFGGCKQILFGDDIDGWRDASETDKKLWLEFQKLYEVLDDNLTGKEYKVALESAKNGVLTQFFTPEVVPRTFYEVLKQFTDVNSLYEPSAGVGVFIEEANKIFDEPLVIAYEKDILTGRILEAIMSKESQVNVNIKPFEESNPRERNVDICISNIPFGAIPIYDIAFDDRNVLSKIHNYFWAKGLTKIKEGGLMCYLVSNMFLDTVTNQKAREYLFSRADFISLTVMPDNLMKDNAGTEAGSHFIVVRKNSSKTGMSDEENLLCVSENVIREGVTMSINKWIQEYGAFSCIGKTKVGKNQYGKGAIEVWWDGPIEGIAEQFKDRLHKDFSKRYKQESIEIPIGKVEITGPGKWRWAEEDKPEMLLESLTTKDVLKEGEMIWDDQIVDIPIDPDDLLEPEIDEGDAQSINHESFNISDEETPPWEDNWNELPEPPNGDTMAKWEDELAKELKEEIQANIKDGCLGKEEDDDPFGANDPIPEQSEEESDSYANEYNKANWKEEMTNPVAKVDDICDNNQAEDNDEISQGDTGDSDDDSVPEITDEHGVKWTKKEKEIMQMYEPIRDLYLQLEKLENEEQ